MQDSLQVYEKEYEIGEVLQDDMNFFSNVKGDLSGLERILWERQSSSIVKWVQRFLSSLSASEELGLLELGFGSWTNQKHLKP